MHSPDIPARVRSKPLHLDLVAVLVSHTTHSPRPGHTITTWPKIGPLRYSSSSVTVAELRSVQSVSLWCHARGFKVSSLDLGLKSWIKD